MKKPRVFNAIVASLALIGIPPAFAEKSHERSIQLKHEGGRFLPGAEEPVTLFPDHPELEDRFSEAAVIRMAYAALEQAIVESGNAVSFELEDFRTYYRRDFGKVLVRDLLSLDAPFRLEVRETEVVGAQGEAVGSTFTPRWAERFTIEDLDEMKEFMDHYRDVTVAAGLRLPDADERHRRMIAVTSYQVTVKFEGESQTYRAVFKWIPGPPGEVTFIVEDHVTEGVDRALVADGVIAPIGILLGRGLEPPAGTLGGEQQ